VSDPNHVESARAVYDVTASRYIEFVGTQIGSATEETIDRSLLTAFVELIRDGPAGGVADVGCGPGRVAAFLAQHGLDVVGVDVSRGCWPMLGAHIRTFVSRRASLQRFQSTRGSSPVRCVGTRSSTHPRIGSGKWRASKPG